MPVVRFCIAVFDVIVTGCLLYAAAIVPYRQNVLKKRVEREFAVLEAGSGTTTANFVVLARIRDDIQQVRRALKISPTDVDLHMELAALYRFMGRYDDAVATYQRALRYHRRPEIYVNLAESQFAAGDLAGATENYAYALAFAPEEAAWVPNSMYGAVALRSKELIARIARD
jgi:tetratricopeptide (TPR) repeat protein